MSASWRRQTFLSSQCVICTNCVASMLLALRPRPHMPIDSELVSPTALRRCRIILPLHLHRPPTHSTSTLRPGRSCFNTWGPAYGRLTARQPASYNRPRTAAPPPHNVTIMCTPHQHPLTSKDQFRPPPRTCWWSLKPNPHILLYGDRGSHCLTSYIYFCKYIQVECVLKKQCTRRVVGVQDTPNGSKETDTRTTFGLSLYRC